MGPTFLCFVFYDLESAFDLFVIAYVVFFLAQIYYEGGSYKNIKMSNIHICPQYILYDYKLMLSFFF